MKVVDEEKIEHLKDRYVALQRVGGREDTKEKSLIKKILIKSGVDMSEFEKPKKEGDTCKRCKSNRILSIGGKSSDLHSWTFDGEDGEGYAPHVENICGGDYIDVAICLECGQTVGKFPVAFPELDDEDQD